MAKKTKKASAKSKKSAAKKSKPVKKAAGKKSAPKAAVRAKPKHDAVPFSDVAQAVKSARTKSDILSILSAVSGMAKKDVQKVFEGLSELISLDLGKKGPGLFTVPGLMKITRVHKPATKAREGINPFTKEPMRFKAKPSRNVVKVRVLKALKSMVN